jgi:hypothetical protein
MQLALNQTDQARTTIKQALAHNMDDYLLRLALYQVGLFAGDTQADPTTVGMGRREAPRRRLAALGAV